MPGAVAQGKDKMGGCRTRAATIPVSNASSFAKRRASGLSYMFGAVLSILAPSALQEAFLGGDLEL